MTFVAVALPIQAPRMDTPGEEVHARAPVGEPGPLVGVVDGPHGDCSRLAGR